VAKIPGIGKSIALKIKELARDRFTQIPRRVECGIPERNYGIVLIVWTRRQKIRALYDRLGISSIEQLQKACEEGRVAELSGSGRPRSKSFATPSRNAPRIAGAFQFGQVAAEAERCVPICSASDALQVDIAGSYRRRKEIVHDLDLLVATKKTRGGHEIFRFPSAGGINHRARPTKSSVATSFGSAV